MAPSQRPSRRDVAPPQHALFELVWHDFHDMTVAAPHEAIEGASTASSVQGEPSSDSARSNSDPILASSSAGKRTSSSPSIPMQIWVTQSPLDEPYIPGMVPTETRAGHLRAEFIATILNAHKEQDERGQQAISDNIESTDHVQEIAHTSSLSGKPREEQHQLDQDNSKVAAKNSGGLGRQKTRMALITWATIVMTTATPSGAPCVVLESPTTVVKAENGDVVILDSLQGVKYLLSLATALTMGSHILRLLPRLKETTLFISKDFQNTLLPLFWSITNHDKLFKSAFRELPRHAQNGFAVQSVAPSPWSNLSLIVLSNSSSRGKTHLPPSSSEPPSRKRKTCTGASSAQKWRSLIVNGQSGPSVRVGTTTRFRVDGKKEYGCYWCKFDPITYGVTCSRIHELDERSLRRRDRHLKVHIERGDVSQEELDTLFRGASGNDEAEMDHKWRVTFVGIFPVYVGVRDVLDPSYDTPLLPPDRDPDGLQARQYHKVASREESMALQMVTPVGNSVTSGSVDTSHNDSGQENGSTQRSVTSIPEAAPLARNAPSDIVTVAVAKPSSSIVDSFQTLENHYNIVLAGLRKVCKRSSHRGIERFTKHLATLELLRTSVRTPDALSKVLDKYHPTGILTFPTPRYEEATCPIQLVFDELRNTFNNALEVLRALEDGSEQEAEQVLSNQLAALEEFNACLLTSDSLHRLVKNFAVQQSEEIQEQQQQSQEVLSPLPSSSQRTPSLTHGSTLDDASENSLSIPRDAHYPIYMALPGVCHHASDSAFRDTANLETTTGWVGELNEATQIRHQSQHLQSGDPNAVWNPNVPVNDDLRFSSDSDQKGSA